MPAASIASPMSPKVSAGLLPYRRRGGVLEVMLIHMGGPFWARKDAGAWSIAKGEYEQPERSRDAARREFSEETGLAAPGADAVDLGAFRQSSGKLIEAWAVEADFDVSRIVSNTFELEWPKGSGRLRAFPEADQADWFDLPSAREKIVRGQLPVLDALLAQVEAAGPGGHDR